MSANLYAINHDLRQKLWCGPAAVAAVTGAPTSVVVSTIKAAGRRTIVTRLYASELIDALWRLGKRRSYWCDTSSRPTFSQFRKARPAALREYALIVNVTGHFVVLAGNRFVDNNNTDPIMASDYARQRKRVRGYIVIME